MTNTKTKTYNFLDGIPEHVLKKMYKVRGDNKGEARKKWIADHFKLYQKTGILDWFAQRVRQEFSIPALDPKTDTEFINIPINNDQLGEVRSKWFSDIDNASIWEPMEERIKSIIQQLYLPRDTYDMFFYYFLYGIIPKASHVNDDEVVVEIANGIYPQDLTFGYTANELKILGNRALYCLYLKRIEATQEEQPEIDKQIAMIPHRIDDLTKRTKRSQRLRGTLKRDIKNIHMLKKRYGKTFTIEEIDSDAKSGAVRKTGKQKATSPIIAVYINPDIQPDYQKRGGDKFRKQAERLKKKFPFLEDFLNAE